MPTHKNLRKIASLFILLNRTNTASIKQNIFNIASMKKTYATLFTLFTFFTFVSAQDSNVTVIGSGEGNNKTNAVNQALRNCIEKSMGAFLSSNTTVTNDSLVKDEIITIASGNIVSYEVLSEVNENENYKATVSAVISPEKLVTSLKSKGFNFELNGGVYAQNILKEEFYSKQEEPALNNFLTAWDKIPFFDFDIKITEPILHKYSSDVMFDKNAEFPKYYNESFSTIFDAYIKHNINVSNVSKRQLRYDNVRECYDFHLNNVPKNVATMYTIYALFIPKITDNYLSFVNSFCKLLNSIAIKNVDEYKQQHADYLALAFPMKYISGSGLDASKFNNAKWDNNYQTLVFYLRNTQIKTVYDKLSEMIKFKSTGLNFHSAQVDDKTIREQLNKGYEMTPTYGFICQYCGDFSYDMRAKNNANNYYVYPYYKNNGTETFIFQTSVLPLFYSLDELQKLKKIEFKSELASAPSESVNKEPTAEDSKKKEKEFASSQLAAMIDSMNQKTTDKNEMIYKTEEVTVKPDQDKEKFIEYYTKNKKYPSEAKEKNISGNVLVSYIIEKDGRITNTKVVKSVGGGCDEEAIRFMSSMPKCTPAEKDGKKVRVMKIGAFNCSPN